MKEEAHPTLREYLEPIILALLFVGSVYLQKFVRKELKMWSKQYKELSRIIFVTVLTLMLILYNYSQKCEDSGISFQNCFYLHFDFSQCLHVLVANTILFAYHIYRLINSNKNLASDSPLRKLVFAPLLEQLLFRAVFYRSSGGHVSIAYLSGIFAIAHLHRHIRKALSGKSRRLGPAMFQLFFTFVFSLYTSYFLKLYQSIVPCILLHMYCNLLGPPIIAGRNSIIYHFFCVVAFSVYLIYAV